MRKFYALRKRDEEKERKKINTLFVVVIDSVKKLELS